MPKNNIIQRKDILKWPHLQNLNIPNAVDSELEVKILIG